MQVLRFLVALGGALAFVRQPLPARRSAVSLRLREIPLRVKSQDHEKKHPFLHVASKQFNVSILPPFLREYASNITHLGEWVLFSPDLSPARASSTVGVAFLSTNLAYFAVSSTLIADGELTIGSLVGAAGIASCVYHFNQLEYPYPSKETQIALLVDYASAATLVSVGAFDIIMDIGLDNLPIETYVCGGLSLLFLFTGWFGMPFPPYGYPQFGAAMVAGKQSPYLLFHSLWHVFSSLTAFYVGEAHLGSI